LAIRLQTVPDAENYQESPRASRQSEWLEGLDIVCLANCEYMTVRSVAEHTMIRLGRKNRILMVEPFNSLPTLWREARLQQRRLAVRWGVRKVEENIWACTPPPVGMIGHTRARWVTSLNSAMFTTVLRSAMRQLDFRDPVLWSYHYNSAGVMRRLGARLSVYDCIDNDPAMARNERQLRIARSHDQDTCRAADLVFACSETLAAERRPFNDNIHEVYCAADVEFYERALDPALDVPDDIRRLRRPVIGYWGGVDTVKIDVDLLREVALARPDWSFVLIGYVWFNFDRSRLASLPNVHLFGTRPYESLPSYLRQMDVCIAPFALNEITRSGDSLKIYEYLAAGRPVVSTRIPSALRMSPPVRLADSSAEFVAAIEQALAEPAAQAARNRAAVDLHSWDHRVAQKSRAVRAMLQASPARSTR
jgi:glycosyltransferase involved in cell wall biosynthesis